MQSWRRQYELHVFVSVCEYDCSDLVKDDSGSMRRLIVVRACGGGEDCRRIEGRGEKEAYVVARRAYPEYVMSGRSRLLLRWLVVS